jgi:hypothetical protein
MTVATSRVIRTPEEWQQHLQAWRQSGLKMTAYAQAHGLNIKSFGNAKRRLNRSTSDAVATVSHVFKRVEVSASSSRGSYRVSFSDGLVIECDRGGDLVEFSGFIQTLRTPR